MVEDGHEVGGLTAGPGTPAARLPRPAGPDGAGSAIESAARWIWHEVTELERMSLDWLRKI